jgi:DNA segregation ATPase FtsK/SpoIIIE-like protein
MKLNDLHFRAAELVSTTQFGSRPMLQRRLRIGPGLAEQILTDLAEHGIVGYSRHSQHRDVLVTDPQRAHLILTDAQKAGQ